MKKNKDKLIIICFTFLNIHSYKVSQRNRDMMFKVFIKGKVFFDRWRTCVEQSIGSWSIKAYISIFQEKEYWSQTIGSILKDLVIACACCSRVMNWLRSSCDGCCYWWMVCQGANDGSIQCHSCDGLPSTSLAFHILNWSMHAVDLIVDCMVQIWCGAECGHTAKLSKKAHYSCHIMQMWHRHCVFVWKSSSVLELIYVKIKLLYGFPCSKLGELSNGASLRVQDALLESPPSLLNGKFFF